LRSSFSPPPGCATGGVRRADADDLRQVYRDHVDAVYAFFAYSVPRTVAEDLTSSTFERVVRSWASYDPRKAGVRTWILAIARNQLTDHYRRASHRRARSIDEEPALIEGLVGVDPLGEVGDRDAFRALLEGSGGREREILALRYGADLSANEVAELLELTSANVHQIASRALRRLRRELSSGGDQ
jgi:RNA polymerase sigma-70 factor (ECF subfamily)